MLDYEPGDRQHPLAPNFLALYLSIIKRYSADDAMLALCIGEHVNTTTEQLPRQKAPPPAPGKRRPPAFAALARRYG